MKKKWQSKKEKKVNRDRKLTSEADMHKKVTLLQETGNRAVLWLRRIYFCHG